MHVYSEVTTKLMEYCKG